MRWDLGDLNFGAFGRAAEVGVVGNSAFKSRNSCGIGEVRSDFCADGAAKECMRMVIPSPSL